MFLVLSSAIYASPGRPFLSSLLHTPCEQNFNAAAAYASAKSELVVASPDTPIPCLPESAKGQHTHGGRLRAFATTDRLESDIGGIHYSNYSMCHSCVIWPRRRILMGGTAYNSSIMYLGDDLFFMHMP